MKKLLLLILLIFSTPAWATDYYVKTGGNDGNTGLNDGQAFASLFKAYDTVSASDTIYLNRDDTWTVTVNRTSSEEAGVGLWLKLDSLTVDAYGTGADPIITAEAQTDQGDERAQHYYSPIEVGIRMGYGPDDITIKNLDIRGPTDGAAIHAYSIGSGLTIQDNNIRGAGWPENALIVAGNSDNGITISGNSFDAIQGAERYAECFEIRGGSGHLITGNTFKGFSAGGAARFADEGTGATIEKNFFYAPETRAAWAWAIVVRNCDGGDYIIRNNVIDMTDNGALTGDDDLRAMAFWGDVAATNRHVYNNTAISSSEDGAFINGTGHADSSLYVYNNVVIGVIELVNNETANTHLRNNIYHACTKLTENGSPGTDSNNVTTDPYIADESMAGTTAADADLTASSTGAINAGYGTPGVSNIPSDDYSGDTRDVGVIDMGAFEYLAGVADSTDPATSGWSPAKSASDVDISANIVFTIADAGDGVDISTVVLTVEGTGYCTAEGSCGNKTLSKTGTTASYQLTFTHAAWSYDQEINVSIDADDLADTPNSMTTDTYDFACGSAPAVAAASSVSGGGSSSTSGGGSTSVVGAE